MQSEHSGRLAESRERWERFTQRYQVVKQAYPRRGTGPIWYTQPDTAANCAGRGKKRVEKNHGGWNNRLIMPNRQNPFGWKTTGRQSKNSFVSSMHQTATRRTSTGVLQKQEHGRTLPWNKEQHTKHQRWTTQNSEEANKREDEKRVIQEAEDAQQDKFGAV